MSLTLAILASGRGSNMTAILDAIDSGKLDASVSTVITNNPEAQAISIAKSRNINTFVCSHRGLSRQEHESKIISHIKSVCKPDYIVLAGYMRVLTNYFLAEFKLADGNYAVINIHPSLLPSFPGAHAYEDAFNYGVKISGITVHLVDSKIDHGPIIAQEAFPRHTSDSLEEFKSRGLAVEHSLYPQVLQVIREKGLSFLPRISNLENNILCKKEAKEFAENETAYK